MRFASCEHGSLRSTTGSSGNAGDGEKWWWEGLVWGWRGHLPVPGSGGMRELPPGLVGARRILLQLNGVMGGEMGWKQPVLNGLI